MQKLFSFFKNFVLNALTLSFCCYSSGHAASATWNNGGAGTSWATLNNWTGPPATVPGAGAGETATFDSTVISTVTTVLQPNLFQISITGAGGYIFTGGTAVAANNITINSAGTNTFRGTAIATGALLHLGNGTTTFSAANGGANTLTSIVLNNATGTIVFNGNTTSATNSLINGTMRGSGTLTGPLTQAAGTLRGTPTITGLYTQNGGTISPSNTGTIGTISIGGGYIQNGGTYTVSLTGGGTSDTLAVTGNVTLNGTVNLDPIPGIYQENTLYTLITSGGITAFNPTLTETHPFSFRLIQNGNLVQLLILRNSLVLPVNIGLLPVNSQRVANYLYADVTPAGPIRQLVLTTLSSSAGVFADTLLQLSPIQYGAFAQVSLRNNVHMANALSRRAINTLCNSTPKRSRKKENCDINFNQMWVEPIGYYYHQSSNNRQRAFDNYTYGVAYGMEFPVTNMLTLGWGTGWSHSNIVWSPVLGNAHTNTVYLGLDAGFSEKFLDDVGATQFINLLVQGDIDFITSRRKIRIPGFARDANSSHNSYNVLAQLAGGVKLPFKGKSRLFLQPEYQLNDLNLFEVGYKETGAGNADLKVNYKHSVFFQPNFKIRVIKEFNKKKICFTPNIFLGWLGNYQLTNGRYTANMYNIIAGEKEFSVTSYDRYNNQLSYGAEFSMTQCKDFLLTACYEGSSLSHINVHTISTRIEWAY